MGEIKYVMEKWEDYSKVFDSSEFRRIYEDLKVDFEKELRELKEEWERDV